MDFVRKTALGAAASYTQRLAAGGLFIFGLLALFVGMLAAVALFAS